MKHQRGRLTAAASALALAMALVPASLSAQSVNDWKLPGATVRPAPSDAQGPVDRDNPVITTAVPRQTATPEAQPSAAASAPAVSRPSAPATSAPRPATAAPRTTTAQQPRPAPSLAAAPTASPATTTQPGTSGTPPSTAANPAPGIGAPPSDSAASAPAPAEAEASGWYWPWIAGAAALIAAIFALLWWRRRDRADAAPEFERPVVRAAEPEPRPQPASTAPLPLKSPPASPPRPQIADSLPPGLGITLEARRMSASLMATTLNYVLILTNNGAEPLSALAVEGDMVSAHASLPPEAQIANDNQRLELRHALVILAPGESAEFTGDFRLPLAAVTPIRAGDAAYFVPLARLRVEASTPAGDSLVRAQTFVVGELPEAPGAALRPFRLDLGPRTYSKLGQRAVN